MTDLDASFRQAMAPAESTEELSLISRFFWAKPPPWLVLAGSFILLLAIITIDYLTGPEVNFPLVYAAPAIVATWFAGRGAGYVMSLVCSIGEMFAELMGAEMYVHTSNIYWNAVSRAVFLLLATTLLSAFKDLSTRLGTMVDQRTRAVRDLALQLSATEDSERRRLAHDIHDGFSQMLSVLKLNLAATLTENARGTANWDHIQDALGTVNELIQRARTLTFDLHPPMLDHLGLVPTIQNFCEQFGRQTGLEVTVNEEGRPQGLPRITADYLFRSVKELVNNAAKHGPAKEIVVSVHWTAAHLRLMIDDDGVGFDPATTLAAKSNKCLGLAGIHERLRALGGQFRLESGVGNGTRVVLEVPLTPQEVK